MRRVSLAAILSGFLFVGFAFRGDHLSFMFSAAVFCVTSVAALAIRGDNHA